MKLYTVVFYRFDRRPSAWFLHAGTSWEVVGGELQDNSLLPDDDWWKAKVWSCKATAEEVADQWGIHGHITEVMEFDVPWLESKP